MKKEWMPKGIHHLYLGHIGSFISILCIGLDILFIHSWTILWVCMITSVLGQVYAWDDLIGDYFYVSTPIKIIDQWSKKNIVIYFKICLWFDKLLGKEK